MKIKNKLEGIKQIWQFDNRWQLLLTRTLFPGENLNVYKFKGIEFLTDHKNGEANGARELLTTGMYKNFLEQMKFDAPINVFDLGANNGGFPLLLKSEKIDIKKLTCVELNPKTYSRMKFNIERNIDCDFRAVNAAVCGQNTFLDIRLGDGGTADSIYNSSNSGENLYRVPGKTFDSLYEESFGDEIVDLCKIDVEGAEFEIFQSNECRKIEKCRFLLIEIHHEKFRKRSELLSILKRFNFDEITDNNKSDDDSNHYVHYFSNGLLNKTR